MNSTGAVGLRAALDLTPMTSTQSRRTAEGDYKKDEWGSIGGPIKKQSTFFFVDFLKTVTIRRSL
jgi:hypothetical protein